MFTGIIQALGAVRSLEDGRLILDPLGSLGDDVIQIGESVALNGCCLTVIDKADGLRFDLSPETLAKTTLGSLAVGSQVNLERAMRADGRFGGHMVQGHVEGMAEIVSVTPNGNSTIFHFRLPAGSERYVIDKGSITLDGISLTVVDLVGSEFDVWVIPHTLAETNLGTRRTGDYVNLEVDMLAKYLEKLTRASAQR